MSVVASVPPGRDRTRRAPVRVKPPGGPAAAVTDDDPNAPPVAAAVVPAGGRGGNQNGWLKTVTTNVKSGYLRKNGAPYSAQTRVTEYFDRNTMPNGDVWFTVTTKVEDPVYSRGPYLTTTDFKKLPEGASFRPRSLR